MNQPTIPMPPEIPPLLTTLPDGVALTGPDGRPAGYVVSPAAYQAMRKALYDRAKAQVSDEDIRRALANPKRHTMDDVWKLFEEK